MRISALKRAGWVLAASLALAACGKPGPVAQASHPPHPGVQVQLRTVMPQGTPSVEWNGQQLALREPPLFSSADIQDVRAHTPDGGMPVVQITFKPASAPRILRATDAVVGRQVALTANDQVLSVATMNGPFGESMQFSAPGTEPGTLQAFVRYLTEGGEPAVLR